MLSNLQTLCMRGYLAYYALSADVLEVSVAKIFFDLLVVYLYISHNVIVCLPQLASHYNHCHQFSTALVYILSVLTDAHNTPYKYKRCQPRF